MRQGSKVKALVEAGEGLLQVMEQLGGLSVVMQIGRK